MPEIQKNLLRSSFDTIFVIFLSLAVFGMPTSAWALGKVLAQPCSLLFQQFVAGYQKTIEVDKVQRERWIQAHPRSLKEGARFLAHHITVVDRSTLEQNLFAAFSRFLSENPNTEVFFVVHETGVVNKSNSVMTGAILDHFSEWTGRPVFSDKDSDKIKRYVEDHPNSKAVVVDDASHTGVQLSSTMELLSRQIGRERVIAVVGYATKAAIREATWFGKIYFGAAIPTIEELVVSEKKPSLRKSIDRIATESAGFMIPQYLYKMSLTVFEHTVVDSHSFPTFLTSGSVPVRDWLVFPTEKKKKIPFITIRRAIYKNLPYLSPTSVFEDEK